MPDIPIVLPPKTIAELPPASSVIPSDQVELNQSGASRSATIGQLLASAPSPFPPTGPAAGVLSGTYPNPGFAPTPTFTGITTLASNENPLLRFHGIAGTPTDTRYWRFGRTTDGNLTVFRMNADDTSATHRWEFNADGRLNVSTVVPLTDNGQNLATTLFVKGQGYITSAALSPYAPLASPTFTGDPQAPTPATIDNDTSIATTAFVKNAIAAGGGGPPSGAAGGDLAGIYPNPTIKPDVALVGAPTLATTTPLGSNGPQIATSAFVKGQSYLTTTVAGTTYLALAGGTLTGALNGTTATFSANVTATNLLATAAITAQGPITTQGGVIHVDRTTDATGAEIYLSCDAGVADWINLRTGSSMRWSIAKNGLAEGGSNAGSNFEIAAYSDAGALLSTPFAINRATGTVTLTSDAVTVLALNSNTNSLPYIAQTNASTGATAAVGFRQSVGGRFVDRKVNYTAQYLQEDNLNILTRYSDFNAHQFRNAAGVAQSRMEANIFYCYSPDASNTLVAYADNTHGYVRPTKAASSLFLGAANGSVVGITATTVVPTSDASFGMGTAVARWATVYSYHGDYIGNLTVGTGSRKATFASSSGSFQNLALNFTDNNFTLPLKLQNLGVTGANQGPGISFDFGNDGTNVISGGYIGCFSTDTWVAAGNRTSKYVFALPLNGAISTAYDMSWQAFRPAFDNGADLGASSFRWKVVYAGTGTINTSGADEKTEIGEISDAEKRAAVRLKALRPKRYKFKDAVKAKGDKARWHFGFVAEEVRDALAAEGLDPWAYGMLCRDEVDGHDRLGLRYDELQSFLISTG